MHTTIDNGSRMPWALGFVDLFPTPLSDLQQDVLQAFAHAVLRAPAREGDAHPHAHHADDHAAPLAIPYPHVHAHAHVHSSADDPHDIIPLAMPEDLARSARAVSRALATLEVPLAKACARFCDDHAWEDCGYARQSDVSREVLGRSERWLRDRAALGRGLLAMPGLERAMLGGDGGAALGVVAAGLIAAIADEDTVETWIARARQVSVAQLKADVRLLRDNLQQARGEGRRTAREGARARDAQAVAVAIWAPEPVHAAFDEALELHRAVCGRDESMASFIEALVAEAANGAQPMGTASADAPDADAPGADAPDADASPFCDEGPRIIERRGAPEDDGESEDTLDGSDSAPDSASHSASDSALHAAPQLALDVDEWLRDHLLDGGALVPPAQAFVRRVLAAHGGPPSRDSVTTAASATATDSPDTASSASASTAPSSASSASPDGSLLDEIRTMLALEHEGEVLLAHCLADLSRSRALRGEGFETFVREVLGKSGAYARKLLAVVHAASASPQLAEAWQSGTLTTDRARTLARAFARTAPDAATHAQWIADAREVTARRLRDAVRLVERERALAPRGQDDPRPTTPPPPGDEAWLASLRRAPGMAAARVRQLVSLAIEANERLWPRCRRIYLDRALADRFRAVLTERARWANGDAHVQHAFGRRWGVPHWVGLVTLLVEYTATYDNRDTFAATEAWRRRVLERDGYRCAVPGCSSRANLEVHHVAFRSAGGGNAPENLVTLCAYHHRRGVHGDGLRIHGAAPRGLAFGMGKRGRRVRWYRADRLLREPQAQRGQSPPL